MILLLFAGLSWLAASVLIALGWSLTIGRTRKEVTHDDRA